MKTIVLLIVSLMFISNDLEWAFKSCDIPTHNFEETFLAIDTGRGTFPIEQLYEIPFVEIDSVEKEYVFIASGVLISDELPIYLWPSYNIHKNKYAQYQIEIYLYNIWDDVDQLPCISGNIVITGQ